LQALEALYQIAEYHSQQKNYRSGIETARRLLDLEPWLEKAHRQLMWMLAKSGDRAAALVQYESCYELLDEELGVEPEEETTELYEQIKSGAITPDDDYNQAEAVIAPPFQVPKLTENFVGRHRDMAWLLDKLTSPSDDEPVAVVGMGGMGKTTLAIAVCHELRDEFEDGVLWANVASGDPAAILEDWAQVFGYDFSRLPDVESRAAAFRGVLAEKKVLMVLDDVVSLARVRPLLPHTPGVKVFITTRDAALAYTLDAQIRELAQLSSDQASQLLTQIVGSERKTAEPEAAQAICDLLQNLPLAVEIVAQRLRLFRSMTLAEMVDRLRNEQQRLAELELSDQAVQASFSISYRALDSYEKRAFVLMGVFNGRSFPREAFAAVAELDYFTAGDRLFSLEGASLVQVEENGRFQQHSLLADFARELLAASEEGDGGYGRFVNYYHLFTRQFQLDYIMLRPEWSNIMVAMSTAYNKRNWQTVADFADNLRYAWFARGRYTEARTAYQWACVSAVELNDATLLAGYLYFRGQAAYEQGDFDEATKRLTDSLHHYENLQDRKGIAQANYLLALSALNQSRYEEADRLLRASKRLLEEINDLNGLAQIVEGQARLLHRQWQYQLAQGLVHEALVLRLKSDNKLGTVQTLRLLIDIELEVQKQNSNDLNQLEIYGNDALQLCQELQDQGELSVTFYSLSRIKFAQGDYEQARLMATKSLSLLERIGDRRSQAVVLGYIAIVEYQQENYEVAIEFGNQCLPLLQSLGDKAEIAITLHNLGWWYHCIDKSEQAASHWKKALAIAEEIGHKALIEKVDRTITKFLLQSN
jgi:tetratricopeptide (TPR) repeat protein